MRSKHSVVRLLVVAFLVAGSGIGAVRAAGTCAPDSGGGDWPSFGADAHGTRSQPLENKIGASTVGALGPKWAFSVTAAGGTGDIPAMPLEAYGCVYVYTGQGFLYALNTDSGALVWSRHVGGVDPAAPTINDGVIYVSQNTSGDREGLHAIALNAMTGETNWVSDAVATDASTSTGAVYVNGLVMIGVGNGEFSGNTGGFALVDAATGAFVKRTYTVPLDEAGAGFGGCSIWSNAAVDPATNYAYVGTAQPGSGAWGASVNESDYCDSIVKIDLDRNRATFGEIVGWRKGTRDDPPYPDVDFGGGGATILRDAAGNQIVVQHQKSGWIHSAYTDSMRAGWDAIVAPGSALGNYTAQATDGTNVFTVGAYPGQVFSINATTGAYNWATPVISPIATNPIAYANGVVYYSDEKGVLNAYDSTSGLPLLARPIALDEADGACARNQSGGVSIARNRVFAVCGGAVVAYGL